VSLHVSAPYNKLLLINCHAHNRPQGPKVVPGRLRPWIFFTFGTTRVVDRQPHAPAAFTLRGNPWYSFLEAESTPGHIFPSVTTKKKILGVASPGIHPETVQLVAHCFNRCAINALQMFYFLAFLMSILYIIPFKHAIHLVRISKHKFYVQWISFFRN
jgi:hypothetical protein